MTRKMELIGQRFGDLIVISQEESKNGRTYWLCECNCGNTKAIMGIALIHGITKSCGCLQKLAALKNLLKIDIKRAVAKSIQYTRIHGYAGKPEYKAWQSMFQLCKDPIVTTKVCSRWKNFENFLTDMGPKPSKDQVLTLIDKNGNFEPTNCYWATRLEVNRNCRLSKANKTGVKGVRWVPKRGRYRVQIGVSGRTKHIGEYHTLQEAIYAREKAEEHYWVNPLDTDQQKKVTDLLAELA